MAFSEQTVREIVRIVHKHVDDPVTLEKIIDELQEVRGDKNFRDAVELFARLAHASGMFERDNQRG
jgi:hypothetical protein